MTPEQWRREQARLSAEIETIMRRQEIASIVFFGAALVTVLAGTITALGVMHIIH